MNNKLVVLSKELKNEKALLGDQLELASLQQALQEKRVELIVQDERIIAFGAIWHREHSIELGSMWVAKEYRGQGLGSTIFSRLVNQAPKDIRLFLITHNPHVVHLALKNGMLEANEGNWITLIPWSASCGPCDRLSETDKPHCPFRAVENECRLFFKI